jgi:hypothetical protein
MVECENLTLNPHGIEQNQRSLSHLIQPDPTPATLLDLVGWIPPSTSVSVALRTSLLVWEGRERAIAGNCLMWVIAFSQVPQNLTVGV